MGHFRSRRVRRKFLKITFNYSIVTNIDYEHLDFYKNYKNLEKSFIKFIDKTPPTGKSIICLDNKNLKKILSKIKIKTSLLMVKINIRIIEFQI